MSYGTCPTCKRWRDMQYHKCPPRWEVLVPDYHGDDWEDAVTVFAHDAESAAEEYADTMDSESDYEICSGGAAFAKVRAVGSEEETSFVITGEMVPQYRASETTEEEFRKDWK